MEVNISRKANSEGSELPFRPLTSFLIKQIKRRFLHSLLTKRGRKDVSLVRRKGKHAEIAGEKLLAVS
jgi:hypothetical protein